jgi:uncharacterized protein (DUF2336 family)
MQRIAQNDSLLSELETAVQSRSSEERVETLRRISDLFLGNAAMVTKEQVAVFDDVLLHLARRVETKALAELGIRLAPIDNAPREVIRHLARHDDATVAAPVLSQSTQLSDLDLVEIAQAKSQDHLLAISGRACLAEQVTDVLVERGGQEVVRTVAGNAGAQFSVRGFGVLVDRAERDDVLAERVGSRIDIPAPMLHDLLGKATEAVQRRILQAAPLEAREAVRLAIASASREMLREVVAPRDYTRAHEIVLRLNQRGGLGEAAVLEYAKARKYEELVASLAVLSTAPIELIERLMQSVRPDGLIVACKAAELKWAAISAILTCRFAHHSVSPQALDEAKTEFIRLTVATAQRVIRFWKVRDVAGKETVVGGR